MTGPMKALLFPLALLATPLVAQPSPSPRPLDPGLQTAVRCAALFSLVAGQQARQASDAADWPPLAERGREFFVRIAAEVMDRAGLDRSGIQALMQAEANELQRTDTAVTFAIRAGGIKTQCLALLDATVPPVIGR